MDGGFMSEKLGEVVNQDGKTAEQLRREADRDYETAANNYNNYNNFMFICSKFHN